MKITDNVITEFSDLFKGYSRCHGCSIPKLVSDERLKVESTNWTKDGPVSKQEWLNHLEGKEYGVGVVILQSNNTCRFGALDIDDYTVDIAALAKQIQFLKLPLIPCRSKSGGTHLYVFTKEDIPAPLLRDKLTEWCAFLGLSKQTEIFPKQVNRANADDKGSWINIPYFNANDTSRYAVVDDGRPLPLEEFLYYAKNKQVTANDLKKVEVFKDHNDPEHLFFTDRLVWLPFQTRRDSKLAVLK